MTINPTVLAVVRCGDNSLHQSWTSGARQFDVGISYFGPDPGRQFPEAAYLHRFRGGKWDGISDFFSTHPETVTRYDYYWFPDDDIYAKSADLEDLVVLAHGYGLDFFQPALDANSYYSHLITLCHSSFRLRYTNFVEIMVPVLSRRLLQEVLPTLADTRSGFGLDFLWPRVAAMLADAGARNVAIVDAVTVTHTRPVGGSLHQFMKKTGGRSTHEELSEAVRHIDSDTRSQINGVSTPRIQMMAAVNTRGRFVPGWRAAPTAAADLLLWKRNKVQSVRPLAVLRHALKAVMAK